uniref:EGF-like domain-containing protein n=1 Tax=Seriola lalandi dorsalis TaxID=1841481 RepID=A0A3B4Z556_SERLL
GFWCPWRSDINECHEERCEWQCVNLPGSYRCICPRGYTLQRDGKRCKGQCGSKIKLFCKVQIFNSLKKKKSLLSSRH